MEFDPESFKTVDGSLHMQLMRRWATANDMLEALIARLADERKKLAIAESGGNPGVITTARHVVQGTIEQIKRYQKDVDAMVEAYPQLKVSYAGDLEKSRQRESRQRDKEVNNAD